MWKLHSESEKKAVLYFCEHCKNLYDKTFSGYEDNLLNGDPSELTEPIGIFNLGYELGGEA